jgi:hypothetical protein
VAKGEGPQFKPSIAKKKKKKVKKGKYKGEHGEVQVEAGS